MSYRSNAKPGYADVAQGAEVEMCTMKFSVKTSYDSLALAPPSSTTDKLVYNAVYNGPGTYDGWDIDNDEAFWEFVRVETEKMSR